VDASKVIVAMVDTGLDLAHEEFGVTIPADRVVGGINVATRRLGQLDIPEEVWEDEYASDTDGHGTLVAGIIGATGNNGKGMAGVSWTCRLMPIMASNYDEDGLFEFPLVSVIRGIRHACTFVDPAGAKVRVINLSLGINTGRVIPLFYDAVAFARTKGILVVGSTGNLGVPMVGAPANTPSVLAVGATSHHVHTEFVAHYSNYGPRLDVVAPGTSIRVTIPTKDSVVGGRGDPPLRNYAFASGTSESAPYVSGLAALVFAKYDPNNASLATPEAAMGMVDAVRTHLKMSVDDYGTPGWDTSWGYGRINADKALSEAALRTFDPALGRRSPRLP
jgi:cell wall-associated protease